MKNYFDTIHQGECIAKKSPRKLTIVYVKRVYPKYRDWLVDILEITPNGASYTESQMWSPSYSDGYKKADVQYFLKMKTILKMTWVSVSPLKEKFIGSMQK